MTVAHPHTTLRRVLLESPFAHPDPQEHQLHLDYARAGLRDAILRGEAPMASHLLYTQPLVLDDGVPDERRRGIDAGHAWLDVVDYVVVLIDHGISSGMRLGIQRAKDAGKRVEVRSLHPDPAVRIQRASALLFRRDTAGV